MQAIMKPQIVKLASSATPVMAVPQKVKVQGATPKTRRSFLDCLMAALAGWAA